MRETVEITDWETNPERMFPILNKIDRIWTADASRKFSDVLLDVLSTSDSKIMTDKEFSMLLDKYIEDKNIK